MQAQKFWREDRVLREINLENIKVFSCDIFDTLVFRTTNKPEDIFEQIPKEALKASLLKKTISPKEFKMLRIEAEKRARLNKLEKQGTREITLEDIYLEFPDKICDFNKLMAIELEVEKQNIYLNQNVYSFLKHCKAQQIKIILLSDMYLSSKQIRDILINTGADITIFDEIIVSNEEGASKSTKGLFNILLRQHPQVCSREIVHLGDNYISDFIHARESGINAYHYILDRVKNEKYELELVKDDLCIGEILALRKQISLSNKFVNEEDNFWYEFGATVLGPIFSLFLDYIISIAEENKIKNIYPIMRDGYIFERMLNEFINKKKSATLNLKPIYTSRKSTYLASLPELNEKTIWSYLNSNQITVESLLNRFNITTHPFEKYNKNTFSSTKNIYVNKELEITVCDEIIRFLLRNDIKDSINRTICEKRKLLVAYFEQEFNMNEPFITIDVGYNGTIVNSIEKAFQMEGKEINAIHLFLISHNKFLNKVLDGIDLRDFIKYHENEQFLNSIHFTPLLIEAFMFGSFGSILEYEKFEDGKIRPIIDEEFIEGRNSKQRELCQMGIIDFYKKYLDFQDDRPLLKERLRASSKKLVWILERFMKYPTANEAKYLGELYSENAFYYKNLEKLCTPEEENRAKEIGGQNYLLSNKDKSNIWPAGVVERVFPYYMSLELYKQSRNNSTKIMANLAEYLLQNRIKECIVYGAGEMGSSLVKMLLACNIEVLKIVDRNESLWGSWIEEIEVISFAQSTKMSNKTYVIASQAFAHEIKEFIINNHSKPDDVIIVDYTNTFEAVYN